jgi:hypothetical protein
MSRSRKSEKKPLSFSTTMRNPKRIVSFLNCLLPFENQILTHDIIMKMVHNAIKEKIYTPVVVRRNHDLCMIYKSEDESYTDKQIDFIIENSPQCHKEAGFAYGWDSRFDTIFKLPMEFGFVKYAMHEPIRISETGHMLIDAMNEEEINEEKIQKVFLNSMMKYQSNNPYRKNANSNVPLLLLLQVLKMLKEDKNEYGAGVFVKELSLFICWPDNDAAALYKKIKEIRQSVKYTYSDEYMYDICLNLLGATEKQKNRFKMSQICGEAVDEYIRKMRTTGVISLRGNGRFVDYNTWELEKINYIIENYSDYEAFEDKDQYYNYMGEVDTVIVSMGSKVPEDTTDLKKKTLKKFATQYSKDTVYSELHKVCKKAPSSDQMLKLLPAPVRMEFLTSIAMQQNFDNIDVTPNYVIDDEGLPINTALGGKADIVCYDKVCQSLVEVTLMCGRQDQVNNEIVPIRRHLLEEKKNIDNTFSVFIAPVIHEDTKQIAEWYKYKDNLDIMTYAVDEFIDVIKNSSTINELLQNNIVTS